MTQKNKCLSVNRKKGSVNNLDAEVCLTDPEHSTLFICAEKHVDEYRLLTRNEGR